MGLDSRLAKEKAKGYKGYKKTAFSQVYKFKFDLQVYKFKFDLQLGSLTVQVAGEHQP